LPFHAVGSFFKIPLNINSCATSFFKSSSRLNKNIALLPPTTSAPQEKKLVFVGCFPSRLKINSFSNRLSENTFSVIFTDISIRPFWRWLYYPINITRYWIDCYLSNLISISSKICNIH